MNPSEAVEFVREHGVVLESARGSVPSLAAAEELTEAEVVRELGARCGT